MTAPPAAPKRGGLLGILALVFGAVAFLFGVVPATAGFAWAFAITAIVLAIVALVRGSGPKWMSFVGIGLAVLGWIIGIALVVAGIGNAINAAIDSPAAGAADSPATTASPTKDAEPTVGQTITNNKKISFTVNSVTCGIATAGPQYFTETAKGQFCEVKYTIINNSTEKISLFASDLTGKIGPATYEADNGVISTFDGTAITTDVNPGLSSNADVFIDIPAGAKLDTLVYKPEFSLFTSPVVVKVP
ncbi:MAG TPA: DUF4352 domain-containing protein [Pseudolysinimonas sp.]|nr:DUF4352 domain-containing protein [Pseudolysinimonas sp.]